MRSIIHSVAVSVAIIALSQNGSGQGAQAPPRSGGSSDPPSDATKVLSAARAALGGEARIAAVKTFVVTGRTRQVRGDNLVPIEFEIQCELPDKYSRRDEIPAQDTGPTTNGFNGESLVQLPKPLPPPPRAGGPAPGPAPQQAALNPRVATLKQDFARLMLGMFASSYSSYPLTFTYLAQAEAPQGKADVLDVKGPANFAARLFINAQTHVPIMVSWEVRGPAGPPRGAPPPAGAAPGALRSRPPQSNIGCISRTTARWTGCNSPSVSGAPSGPTPRKKPPSTVSASMGASIPGDSRLGTRSRSFALLVPLLRSGSISGLRVQGSVGSFGVLVPVRCPAPRPGSPRESARDETMNQNPNVEPNLKMNTNREARTEKGQLRGFTWPLPNILVPQANMARRKCPTRCA